MHLKSEQLLCGLALDQSLSLSVFALPFVEREQRTVLFEHRPNMRSGADMMAFCRFYDLPFQRIQTVNEIGEGYDACLIAGAGLLPGEFVERVPTINCHPGLIPAVRGLDAFKWAIHDNQPLGITLHLIDAEVDKGVHLISLETPIFASDTIENVASRHYHREIALMLNFRRWLKDPAQPFNVPERTARMRMPKEVEQNMLDHAEEYIQMHSAKCDQWQSPL